MIQTREALEEMSFPANEVDRRWEMLELSIEEGEDNKRKGLGFGLGLELGLVRLDVGQSLILSFYR